MSELILCNLTLHAWCHRISWGTNREVSHLHAVFTYLAALMAHNIVHMTICTWLYGVIYASVQCSPLHSLSSAYKVDLHVHVHFASCRIYYPFEVYHIKVNDWFKVKKLIKVNDSLPIIIGLNLHGVTVEKLTRLAFQKVTASPSSISYQCGVCHSGSALVMWTSPMTSMLGPVQGQHYHLWRSALRCV